MNDDAPETVRPLTPKEIRELLADIDNPLVVESIQSPNFKLWVAVSDIPALRATLTRYCDLAEMLEDVPGVHERLDEARSAFIATSPTWLCDFHPNGCAPADARARYGAAASGYAGVEHQNQRLAEFTAHDESTSEATDAVALKPEMAFDHSDCEHEEEFIDLAICEMDTSVGNVELTTLSDCSPSVRQIISAWERLKLVMFETYTIDAREAKEHDLGEQEEG